MFTGIRRNITRGDQVDSRLFVVMQRFLTGRAAGENTRQAWFLSDTKRAVGMGVTQVGINQKYLFTILRQGRSDLKGQGAFTVTGGGRGQGDDLAL